MITATTATGSGLVRDEGVDPAFPERATRYGASGFGGSAIFIDENLDRVIAITSSNYIPPLGEGEIDDSTIALGKIVNDPTCSFLM